MSNVKTAELIVDDCCASVSVYARRTKQKTEEEEATTSQTSLRSGRLKVDPVKYDHSLLSVPEFLLNHGQQSVFAEL